MEPSRTSETQLTNPLRFCEQLYAVVVGLGLAIAANQIVAISGGGVEITAKNIPLFVAYLTVAFPLAHGAVRYLDLAYVEHRLGSIPPVKAVTDVLMDGVRMWWLIVLALFVSEPVEFAFVLALLLVSGLVRGILSRVIRTPRSDLERNLEKVDGALLVVTVVILAVALIAFEDTTGDRVIRIGLLVPSLVYPFGMYVSSYRYFFANPR